MQTVEAQPLNQQAAARVVADRMGTDTPVVRAVLTILEETEQLEKPVKDAFTKTIRQFPQDLRWAVTEGDKIYAIATAAIPEHESPQIAIQTLRIAELRAVNELFVSKGLLDRYVASGLDDVSVLKNAVRAVASSRSFQGSAALATKMSTVVDDWAIALVIANERTFVIKLTDDTTVEDVRNAYRTILHDMMRQLMAVRNWNEAIKIWEHCEECALFAPDLFVDAAKVEIERANETAAVSILQAAFETYRDHPDDQFFETVGGLLEPIKMPEAQALAMKSYQQAILLILQGRTTQ